MIVKYILVAIICARLLNVAGLRKAHDDGHNTAFLWSHCNQ